MRLILICIFFCSFIVVAQNPIDVKIYDLRITLNDTSDVIDVVEKITVNFLDNCEYFELDLVAKNKLDKGMKVHSIQEYGDSFLFDHVDSKLRIYTSRGKKSTEQQFTIRYSGIPIDGLVIGENKYSERTFFGDNWPTRAQNWIACIDHPSDKALVKFTIIAPKKYSIVAVGERTSIVDLENSIQQVTYISENVLPTKVIVFGMAEMSTEELTSSNEFPITSWVYNQSKTENFSDLKVAVDPLNYYIDKIGPYPFEKLANVQSTTRFGGMENAGCIFYDEHAFTGENKMENLIAHEIAHQWFGNTVTESDWKHLWLSEGFATYLTNLHIEHKYGREAMNSQLIKDKQRIIKFENQVKRPVIDTITTDLMQLLNPNSYQKGSWFLHMLRNKIGDDTFWRGIKQFYNNYKYKNASSEDFRAVMEEVSEHDLRPFFNQWLRQGEMPKLKISTQKKCFKRKLIIEQTQSEPFTFPLDIEITENGQQKTLLLNFTKDISKIEISLNRKGDFEYKLDPNTNLLFRQTSNDNKRKDK